jgi:hypothetical protein
MKIIVISIPKSGTYLMGNILENLGFTNTYKHLSKKGGQEYDPNNIQDGIKNPRKYDSKKSLEENLNEIQDGQYALSHLEYDDCTSKLLEEFFTIYLERDEKEVEASFKRWCKISGRSYKPWRKEKLNYIKLWKEHSDYKITFDDMINKNVKKIDFMQLKLFGEVKYDSKEILIKSLDMDSMTKVR